MVTLSTSALRVQMGRATARWASSRACLRHCSTVSLRWLVIATQEIVATGYADGTILLVRMGDGAEIVAKKPGDAPVSALAWSAAGNKLAFGTDNGEGGVVDLA